MSKTSTMSSSSSPMTVYLLGAPNTGKTSLLSSMLHEKFIETYSPTVEDVHRSTLDWQGQKVRVDFVDTSGELSCACVRKIYAMKADAILLVYNAGNESSFQQVQGYKQEITEIRGEDNIHPIIIVANKSDKAKGSIKRSPSLKMTTQELTVNLEWDLPFVATSAKTGDNVKQLEGTVLSLLFKGEGCQQDSRQKREKLSKQSLLKTFQRFMSSKVRGRRHTWEPRSPGHSQHSDVSRTRSYSDSDSNQQLRFGNQLSFKLSPIPGVFVNFEENELTAPITDTKGPAEMRKSLLGSETIWPAFQYGSFGINNIKDTSEPNCPCSSRSDSRRSLEQIHWEENSFPQNCIRSRSNTVSTPTYCKRSFQRKN